MHRVQTNRLVFVFPIVTRSRCRFGLNRRLAIPVTLVPTPPKYLALPRVVTRFPVTAVLPQTSQCRAIATSSSNWIYIYRKGPVYRFEPAEQRVRDAYDLTSLSTSSCTNPFVAMPSPPAIVGL